ncbi:DnaJ-like protein DjlA [bacterium HR40]|nr:DnaJ-like protein DjlA [bacterium HR40]
MLPWLVAGALLLLGALVLLRWLATVSPSDLAQALRTFVAVFSALASTGLVFMGRFGLALVTLAATAMAVRALLRARRGADPMPEEDTAAAEESRVETAFFDMRLDRRTGRLDGRVLSGRFAGTYLSSMSVPELLELRAEIADDPDSLALLEAYLDRREPLWRTRRQESRSGRAPDADPGHMDEDTAYAILGLEPGADDEAIREAHRRLMAKLHPDHGGSNFLATQINRARDVLLGRRRTRRN